jgi:site-specific DNA-methyltransferase (adenine-specific)
MLPETTLLRRGADAGGRDGPGDPLGPLPVAGDHLLLPGDALDLLARLPAASVDAVITDPPYASGGMSWTDRMREPTRKYQQSRVRTAYPMLWGDTMDQRTWMQWSIAWMHAVWRVLTPGGIICVFTDWRQLPATTDCLQWNGRFIWRGMTVWHKPNARPVMGRFVSQCEYVIWGSKGTLGTRTAPPIPGMLSCMPVSTGQRQHLTEKPLPVMQWLLEIVPPGGVVLDPFMGSDVTGEAAIQRGCAFLGFELEPDSVAVAQARLDTAQAARHAARRPPPPPRPRRGDTDAPDA